MEYRIINSSEIKIHRESLIALMKIVLEDNITQVFLPNQAEQYVNKIPGYIDDGSAIVVGAFESNRLVGFSWAYELSIFGERRIHIDMIGVDLKYRKKGIARNLIDLQIEETRKRGIHIIEAMTTKANENSYNWFHSIGFEDERIKVKRSLEF